MKTINNALPGFVADRACKIPGLQWRGFKPVHCKNAKLSEIGHRFFILLASKIIGHLNLQPTGTTVKTIAV
jgi:hypothetical protein